VTFDPTSPVPTHHTPEGGVLIGSSNARRFLVIYEDAQCPYCRKFEETSGDMLRRETASGNVAVEYRIRSFLGGESVRAANALALAAEAGRFEDLLRTIYESQPAEHSGGFTHDDLVSLGAVAGLTSEAYVTGVREGRYEDWAVELDEALNAEDVSGTPYAILDGQPLDPAILYDREAFGAVLRG
jgi:hypothetical protein